MQKKLAITVMVILITALLTSTALAAVRKGSSSGRKWFFVRSEADWGWHYKGTSKSTSTITENIIDVQGELQIGGVTHDACHVSRSGRKAVCSTNGELRLPLRGRVESDHFFSTPGFGRTSFSTAKNL